MTGAAVYDVQQVTHYIYGQSVPFSRHIVRMSPDTLQGQTVLSADLQVDPQPCEWQDDRDFFGNRCTRLLVATPHEALRVLARARVRLAPPEPVAARGTPPWETIAASVMILSDGGAHSPVHGLWPSPFVPLDPAIAVYAAQSFPAGCPVLAGAEDLAARIHADFIYDPAATSVDTDPRHAFALRRGVCQDFAHVMIAGLRGLGLPARYVSGWLRTVPPPGAARLQGADATHAWVEVWCGPETGWIALDPTNAIRVGTDHIRLAAGRDYGDVAPLDGVIWSEADHALCVAVDVVPVVEGDDAAG